MAANIANARVGVSLDLSQAERQIRQFESRAINLNFNNSRPLGRLTGDVNEFEKSMSAANARVLAFGAAAAVIGGVSAAMHAMVTESIAVEKALTSINATLGASQSQLSRFSDGLFSIARQTESTFANVAKAAEEFSHQGLSVSEVLRRTSDAMTLVRTSGLPVVEVVKSLTSTVNAFNQEALTTTKVADALTAVSTRFGVGMRDLTEAFAGVSTSAQQVKLPFNDLIGLITRVQQVSGKGGEEIGEAFRTIFTRIQSQDTLKGLNDIGVAVKTVQNNTLPAIDILSNLAQTFDRLGDTQKAQVAELLGGVRQVAILKTALGDLNSQYSVYRNVVDAANNSTGEAARRQEELNKTIGAQANAALANLQKLAAGAGNLVFGPVIKNLLGAVNEGSNAFDGDSIGKKVGTGILRGIGDVLSGPGLVAGGVLAAKLLKSFGDFAVKAAGNVLEIGKASEKELQLQTGINALLQQTPGLYSTILAEARSVTEQEELTLNVIRQQAEAQAARSRTVGNLSAGLAERGVRFAPGKGAFTGIPEAAEEVEEAFAGGYIPNMVNVAAHRAEISEAAREGYSVQPSQVRTMTAKIDGKTTNVVYNSRERVIQNFANTGEPAIIPPGKSIGDLVREKINSAQGFVPNFSSLISLKFGEEFGAIGLKKRRSTNFSLADFVEKTFPSKTLDDKEGLLGIKGLKLSDLSGLRYNSEFKTGTVANRLAEHNKGNIHLDEDTIKRLEGLQSSVRSRKGNYNRINAPAGKTANAQQEGIFFEEAVAKAYGGKQFRANNARFDFRKGLNIDEEGVAQIAKDFGISKDAVNIELKRSIANSTVGASITGKAVYGSGFGKEQLDQIIASVDQLDLPGRTPNEAKAIRNSLQSSLRDRRNSTLQNELDNLKNAGDLNKLDALRGEGVGFTPATFFERFADGFVPNFAPRLSEEQLALVRRLSRRIADFPLAERQQIINSTAGGVFRFGQSAGPETRDFGLNLNLPAQVGAILAPRAYEDATRNISGAREGIAILEKTPNISTVAKKAFQAGDALFGNPTETARTGRATPFGSSADIERYLIENLNAEGFSQLAKRVQTVANPTGRGNLKEGFDLQVALKNLPLVNIEKTALGNEYRRAVSARGLTSRNENKEFGSVVNDVISNAVNSRIGNTRSKNAGIDLPGSFVKDILGIDLGGYAPLGLDGKSSIDVEKNTIRSLLKKGNRERAGLDVFQTHLDDAIGSKGLAFEEQGALSRLLRASSNLFIRAASGYVPNFAGGFTAPRPNISKFLGEIAEKYGEKIGAGARIEGGSVKLYSGQKSAKGLPVYGTVDEREAAGYGFGNIQTEVSNSKALQTNVSSNARLGYLYEQDADLDQKFYGNFGLENLGKRGYDSSRIVPRTLRQLVEGENAEGRNFSAETLNKQLGQSRYYETEYSQGASKRRKVYGGDYNPEKKYVLVDYERPATAAEKEEVRGTHGYKIESIQDQKKVDLSKLSKEDARKLHRIVRGQSALQTFGAGFVPSFNSQISAFDAQASGLTNSVGGLKDALRRETTNTGVSLSQVRVNFSNEKDKPGISVTNTRDEGLRADPQVGFDRVRRAGGNIFEAGSGKEFAAGFVPNLVFTDGDRFDLEQDVSKRRARGEFSTPGSEESYRKFREKEVRRQTTDERIESRVESERIEHASVHGRDFTAAEEGAERNRQSRYLQTDLESSGAVEAQIRQDRKIAARRSQSVNLNEQDFFNKPIANTDLRELNGGKINIQEADALKARAQFRKDARNNRAADRQSAQRREQVESSISFGPEFEQTQLGAAGFAEQLGVSGAKNTLQKQGQPGRGEYLSREDRLKERRGPATLNFNEEVSSAESRVRTSSTPSTSSRTSAPVGPSGPESSLAERERERKIAAAERSRARIQHAGFALSFAAPLLAGAIANNLSDPRQQRQVEGIGSAVGTGAALASFGGKFGVNAGAAVAVIGSLKALVDNVKPSFEDLSKTTQELAAKKKEEIESVANVLKAQSSLEEAVKGGTTPEQLKAVQSQYANSLTGVTDPGTRARLLNASNDSERTQILNEMQKKSNQQVGASEALTSAAGLEEKFKKGFGEGNVLGIKNSGGQLPDFLANIANSTLGKFTGTDYKQTRYGDFNTSDSSQKVNDESVSAVRTLAGQVAAAGDEGEKMIPQIKERLSGELGAIFSTYYNSITASNKAIQEATESHFKYQVAVAGLNNTIARLSAQRAFAQGVQNVQSDADYSVRMNRLRNSTELARPYLTDVAQARISYDTSSLDNENDYGTKMRDVQGRLNSLFQETANDPKIKDQTAVQGLQSEVLSRKDGPDDIGGNVQFKDFDRLIALQQQNTEESVKVNESLNALKLESVKATTEFRAQKDILRDNYVNARRQAYANNLNNFLGSGSLQNFDRTNSQAAASAESNILVRELNNRRTGDQNFSDRNRNVNGRLAGAAYTSDRFHTVDADKIALAQDVKDQVAQGVLPTLAATGYANYSDLPSQDRKRIEDSRKTLEEGLASNKYQDLENRATDRINPFIEKAGISDENVRGKIAQAISSRDVGQVREAYSAVQNYGGDSNVETRGARGIILRELGSLGQNLARVPGAAREQSARIVQGDVIPLEIRRQTTEIKNDNERSLEKYGEMIARAEVIAQNTSQTNASIAQLGQLLDAQTKATTAGQKVQDAVKKRDDVKNDLDKNQNLLNESTVGKIRVNAGGDKEIRKSLTGLGFNEQDAALNDVPRTILEGLNGGKSFNDITEGTISKVQSDRSTLKRSALSDDEVNSYRSIIGSYLKSTNILDKDESKAARDAVGSDGKQLPGLDKEVDELNGSFTKASDAVDAFAKHLQDETNSFNIRRSAAEDTYQAQKGLNVARQEERQAKAHFDSFGLDDSSKDAKEAKTRYDAAVESKKKAEGTYVSAVSNQSNVDAGRSPTNVPPTPSNGQTPRGSATAPNQPAMPPGLPLANDHLSRAAAGIFTPNGRLNEEDVLDLKSPGLAKGDKNLESFRTGVLGLFQDSRDGKLSKQEYSQVSALRDAAVKDVRGSGDKTDTEAVARLVETLNAFMDKVNPGTQGAGATNTVNVPVDIQINGGNLNVEDATAQVQAALYRAQVKIAAATGTPTPMPPGKG